MSGWIQFILIDILLPFIIAVVVVALYHFSVHDDEEDDHP